MDIDIHRIHWPFWNQSLELSWRHHSAPPGHPTKKFPPKRVRSREETIGINRHVKSFLFSPRNRPLGNEHRLVKLSYYFFFRCWSNSQQSRKYSSNQKIRTKSYKFTCIVDIVVSFNHPTTKSIDTRSEHQKMKLTAFHGDEHELTRAPSWGYPCPPSPHPGSSSVTRQIPPSYVPCLCPACDLQYWNQWIPQCLIDFWTVQAANKNQRHVEGNTILAPWPTWPNPKSWLKLL